MTVENGIRCFLFTVSVLLSFDISQLENVRNDICPIIHANGSDLITTNSVGKVCTGEPKLT